MVVGPAFRHRIAGAVGESLSGFVVESEGVLRPGPRGGHAREDQGGCESAAAKAGTRPDGRELGRWDPIIAVVGSARPHLFLPTGPRPDRRAGSSGYGGRSSHRMASSVVCVTDPRVRADPATSSWGYGPVAAQVPWISNMPAAVENGSRATPVAVWKFTPWLPALLLPFSYMHV